MANQGADRRQVLEMLAKVAAVSQFPGFCRWTFAAQHEHEASVQPRAAAYEPQFFTPTEYRTIDQITELIIPRDESPGAHDAGVAEFIDFMVVHDEDIQYAFREGLAWLNAKATQTDGQDFSGLPADRQEIVMRRLAYRDHQSPTEGDGEKFFQLIRRYTVMGYYTSRVGLEQLEYPGLRIYSASPECPHKDDPEHRHLPPPKF
jgi:gluconate 2-dehydrogenase gamma chain